MTNKINMKLKVQHANKSPRLFSCLFGALNTLEMDQALVTGGGGSGQTKHQTLW